MNMKKKDAVAFAVAKHKDQKDDAGNPYINHCIQVGQILESIGVDENLIIAGFLHDTLEDTETSYEELVKEFGIDIADLVNEVTHKGQKDQKGYWFPRLKTRRGIMLKFADRLSNLNRMDCWTSERQEQYLKKSKFWKSE